MSQMSQVPQVSECRHLEMGKECGDFPDDQVTIFWRKIMALMDNFMVIRLGSRPPGTMFSVSQTWTPISCIHVLYIFLYIVIHIFTCIFWNLTWGKHMNLHRCSLQHVQGDFVSFPKRSRQGAVRMTRREPAGRAQFDGKKFQSLEGCEMMADFLLKDMDMYIIIYFHIDIVHIQYIYIIYPYIYIYTQFFYTYATFLGGLSSSRSSYCWFMGPPGKVLRRLYRRSKPYNDEVGNLRLLVNWYGKSKNGTRM